MPMSDLGRPARRLSPLALALVAVALLLGSTGGAVAGAMITGSQIKDGTVASADIKNDSLSKADLIDEPRTWAAARTATINDFVSVNYASLVSKGVTTTAPGFLTINTTLYAEDDGSLDGAGRLVFSIRVDGDIVDGYRSLTFNGSSDGENGALTAVVPVTKGAHTISLVAYEAGAGSFIHSSSISAVFSPSGSTSGLEFTSRPVTPRNANR